MAHFIYKAKKGPTEVLEGKIEADSEKAAINKLIESGFYPLWIKEEALLARESKGASFFSKKIKTKDLANFTRQLSELLDSGLALFDALNVIENQIDSLLLKEVISNIKDSIKDGNTFSDSLKAYPHIFSKLYVNLVRSGEASSALNQVLNNISDFLEKQEDIKTKVITALAYPILMAIVGFLSIFILITFVIPKLAKMFIEMGEALPLPTRILIGLSNFARSYFIWVIFIIVALVLFIRKSNKISKRAMDNFKLKIPIFGALIKKTEFARFSGTLSMLLKNGVPILDSLKITSDIVDNEVMKEELNRIHNDVKAGSALAAAIKKKHVFPQFIVNMVAIGEEGGFLDKTLAKVAKNYESEIDRTIKILASLLEPIMILIMGLIVGFIVISMLLPVFQISLAAH